jgi:NitT/TauT family transport system permease protein
MMPNEVSTGMEIGARQATARTSRSFVISWARLGLWLIPWAGLIALWYVIRASGLVRPGLIPSPDEVATTFGALMATKGLWFDVLISSYRVLAGLLLGVALAVPVGFLLGWYRPAGRLLDPVINFFRALPPIALIPLVIVYFGIGEVAKVIILFYAAFFSGVIVMYEGIAQLNPLFVRVSRTLGASDGEIFRFVIVPLAVPHLLTALRVALGVTWATLVASELVAAQRGLGAVIQNASNYFQLRTVYAGIICIGAVALLMDAALRALSRRLLDWQERIAP